MLFSKTTSSGSVVSSTDKYSYDSAGNLTSIQTTSNGLDTAYVIREYDSLNRLTMIKNIINGMPIGDQFTYHYDTSGNVNCLFQIGYTGKMSSNYNYILKFNESEKVTDEIALSMFRSDSTWGDTLDIIFNYDEYGRIIQMGQYTWFHYNTDGNLDSMVNTHTNLSGYLANKGTFVDSYGNSITLPYYDGINHFYYSRFITGIKKDKSNIKTFTLSQNYPNPFNPTTTINYSIPKVGFVTLKVYDILGREIVSLVNDEKQPGEYSVKFDGTGFSSGIYFYKLQAGEFISTKKFILMK
ncbi:MAG: T9SS type A sorting domain-containing protein [Ignavibacteriaceae bacterium]